MKLIIQIPCLNEAETLPAVLATMPKKIPGIDSIELQVIDDGSTDDTAAIASKHGVQHIITHTRNQGLGRSFHDGIMHALAQGADIVVNTDGDNQYPSERIGDLVQPILDGKADIVVGDRQTRFIDEFSPLKKFMQRLGTSILNHTAGTDVPDAASGFRAYSRTALLQLNTITRFSYCMETFIQAGNKRLSIVSIPVTVNPKTRESRLFGSMWEHVAKSGVTIIRGYVMYKPYVLFNGIALVLLLLGAVPFIRYLYYFMINEHGAHLQSLIVGAVLLIASFVSIALGILADLTRTNRVLLENTLEIVKEHSFRSDSHTDKS